MLMFINVYPAPPTDVILFPWWHSKNLIENRKSEYARCFAYSSDQIWSRDTKTLNPKNPKSNLLLGETNEKFVT